MKKVSVLNGLDVYTFAPENESELVDYKIVVLERNDDVLIIDTAFKRHFNQLFEELTEKGKSIKKVIMTHFHSDHIGGLSKLKDIEVYGSIKSQETLKKMFGEKDYTAYEPNKLVKDFKTITFGDFKIDMYVNPGHSVDGLLVVVDDKIMHVGDDVIYGLNGGPLLPYASERDYQAHIKSLLLIKDMVKKNSILIPAHGKILRGRDEIIQDLEFRLVFLYEKLRNNDLTEQEFTEKTGIQFGGNDWYK